MSQTAVVLDHIDTDQQCVPDATRYGPLWNTIRNGNCGDAYDSLERADETTEAVAVLVGRTPTVNQVRANTLRDAAADLTNLGEHVAAKTLRDQAALIEKGLSR